MHSIPALVLVLASLLHLVFCNYDWVAFYRSRSAVCQEKLMCNGDMCAEVCEVGTAEVDPWSDYVLAFQRWLQFNESYIYHQIPGTHNSHISVAYGFGIERDFISALNYGGELDWLAGDLNLGEGVDQYLSVIDQFNIGIRHVEIDINWGPWVVNDSSSESEGIVVCHTPVIDPLIEAQLELYLEERGLAGKVEYNIHHLDCKKQFVSFYDSMNEIKNWLLNATNKNEFVIIYFDTKWDILEYQAQWGISYLSETFGDMIFTPQELEENYKGKWPSLRELVVNQGKRLLFEDVKEGWAEPEDSFIFVPPLWSGFQYGANSFEVFPDCKCEGKDVYGKNFTRALDDTITDSKGKDRQYRNMINIATRCGGNIVSPHMINPTEMWRFVWTFARGEPKGLYMNEKGIGSEGSNETCVAMKPSGFWAVKNCNEEYPAACVKADDRTDWYVSESASSWHSALKYSDARNATCPAGYLFATPTDGYQNGLLQAQALAQYVWLNVDIMEFEQYRNHLLAAR